MVFIIVWIGINSVHLIHFDPWPFDGLKLILTIEASFMGSMILMSQNRQAEVDRKMVYKDFIINWVAKKEIEKILPLVKDDHSRMLEVLELLKKDKPPVDR